MAQLGALCISNLCATKPNRTLYLLLGAILDNSENFSYVNQKLI
ncbi:hypothetical protein J558_4225 [Acinetobacter baumannii 1106579]|nr:hypothetical protein J558_4225 [Acinetobacter baumannii 1106579]